MIKMMPHLLEWVSAIFLLLLLALTVTLLFLQKRFNRLRESEKRFRAMADFLPQSLYETDLNGLLTYASRQAYANFGYSPEDLRQGLNVLKMVAAEDQARAKQNMMDTLRGGKSGNEYLGVRKDGSTFPMLVNATAILRNGRVAGTRGIILDITELKKTEMALRESEETAQALLNASNDAAIMMDVDGTILTSNLIFAKRLGTTPEELVGKNLHELIPPGLVRSRRKIIDEIIRTTKPQRFEDERNGIWMENSIFPIQNAQGRVIKLAIYSRDITERRQADEAKRQSEASFKHIIDNLPMPVMIIDASNRVEMVNSRFVEAFGYTLAEIPTLASWQELAYPDAAYRQTVIATWQADSDSFGTDGMVTRMFDVTGKDGLVRNVVFRQVLLQSRLLLVLEDVTDRIRAEQLQTALFQIAETAGTAKDMKELYFSIHQVVGLLMNAKNFYIAVLDKKTDMLHFPYFIDETEPQPEPYKRGRGLTEFVLNSGDPMLIEAERLRQMAAMGEVEIVGQVAEDWLGVPLKNTDRETFGVMVVQSYDPHYRHSERDMDILVFVSQQIATSIQRRQTEEELRQTEEQFQQLQKVETIGTLVGSIAHDYNNLLTSILGNAQLLEFKIKQEKSPLLKHVKAIETACENAAGIVQQLLAFTRWDEPQLELLHLSSLIRDWQEMLRRTVEENIRLQLQLASDLYTIKADRSKVQQVLMNLIVNGRDAMPEGGTISITTFNITLAAKQIVHNVAVPAGSYACFAVIDNGIGITTENMPKLFEPFFTTKGKGKGTGLGLSTVKRIVEQMNGYIGVESKSGTGAQFTVIIPQYEDTAIYARTEPIKGKKVPLGEGQMILVVEDEDEVRSILVDMLRVLKYDAVAAANGREALTVMARRSVSLILTDIRMPEMGGVDLLKRIRKEYPHLQDRVVGMTAYSEESIEKLAGFGFCRVIRKPPDLKILGELLEDLFQV